MSDSIPLHKLRRNKQPRTPSEDTGISLFLDTNAMPSAVVAKAAIATRRNREYESRRRGDRYADDSEEEQGLLGSPVFEEGSSEFDETTRNRSPVCPTDFSNSQHGLRNPTDAPR